VSTAASIPILKRGELARLKVLLKIGEALSWLDKGIEYFPIEKRARIAEVIRLLENAEKALDAIGDLKVDEMIARIDAGGNNGGEG
jgi:hypothetical protein